MSLRDVQKNFKKKSVLVFLVLTIITLWMYALVWYIKTSRTINRLSPSNPIPISFIVGCTIFAVINFAFFPIEIMTDDNPRVMQASNLWVLVDRALTIIWTFMLRSRINLIRTGERHWLNGLGTLFLGPFYIQYKINRMIDAPHDEDEQVVAPDLGRASQRHAGCN